MKNKLLLLLILLGIQLIGKACDITLTLSDASRKASYKVKDEIVVLVTVKHTHRVCKLPIEETTYEPDGVKILAATDWKEVSAGQWTRKIKLEVTGKESRKRSFAVRRKCSRDHHVAVLSFDSVP